MYANIIKTTQQPDCPCRLISKKRNNIANKQEWFRVRIAPVNTGQSNDTIFLFINIIKTGST